MDHTGEVQQDSISAAINVSVEDHFLFLIYPFRRSDDSTPPSGSDWRPYLNSMTRQERLDAIDDAFAFLPEVRRALMPEVDFLARVARPPSLSVDYTVTEEDVQQANAETLKAFSAGLCSSRWRVTGDTFDNVRPIRVTAFDENNHPYDPVEVACDWVDVMLFPARQGFLIIRLSMTGTIAEIARTHRSLTKVFHRRRLRIRPAKLDTGGGETTWRELIAGLLGDFSFSTDDGDAQVMGSSFHIFSHTFTHELLARETCDGAFDSPAHLQIFQMLTGESLHSTGYPGGSQLADYRDRGILHYWRDWMVGLHWDSWVGLSEAHDFGRTNLARNVEALHLPLFVLFLYQQARTSQISSELAGAGLRVDASDHLARLSTDILQFRNQFTFTEVSYRAPVITAIFAHLSRYFSTEKRFLALQQEMDDLRAQVQARAQSRTNRLVGMATFMAIPLALVLSMFGPRLEQYAPHGWQWAVATTVLIVAVFTWLWGFGTWRLRAANLLSAIRIR